MKKLQLLKSRLTGPLHHYFQAEVQHTIALKGGDFVEAISFLYFEYRLNITFMRDLPVSRLFKVYSQRSGELKDIAFEAYKMKNVELGWLMEDYREDRTIKWRIVTKEKIFSSIEKNIPCEGILSALISLFSSDTPARDTLLAMRNESLSHA